MAFFGSFVHAVDDRGRVAIPARFRADLRDGFVTRGSGEFLVLYPKEVWERMIEQRAYSDIAPDDYHEYLLGLYAVTQEITWDGQGRMLLLPWLREHAGLRGNVVFVGMNTAVELYNETTFNERIARVNTENWPRIRSTVARMVAGNAEPSSGETA